jgi:DNA-binding GntR family transcriptional regulator
VSRASDHAYAEIRSLILSGDAPPGAPLREEQLADICGVSRTPVREALRRLEAELYVVRTGGNRMAVADWSRDDLDEMFALRAMLEGHAAARAATRIDADGIETLRACNAEVSAAVASAEADVARFLAANRRFHDTIIGAAQSPRLATMLAALVEQPVVRRTATRYSHTELQHSAREHEELTRACAARDPEWAKAVMTAHIRRAAQAFSAGQAETR